MSDSPARAEQSLTPDAGELAIAALKGCSQRAWAMGETWPEVETAIAALTAAKPSGAHTEKALEEVARETAAKLHTEYSDEWWEEVSKHPYGDRYQPDYEQADEKRRAIALIILRALKQVAHTGRAESGQELAKRFHDTYERLAPQFGYETRADTKQFDADSPNGRLMIAVCTEILATLRNSDGEEKK